MADTDCYGNNMCLLYSGKEIDVLNPWNMTGKQLDLDKSAVLSQIMSNGRNGAHNGK